MSDENLSIDIRKRNLETLWFISERWFRILEFSLILATLYYFKDKTGSTIISIVYWLSWMVFFMWCLELGELISDRINTIKKFGNREFLVWVLSMMLIIAMYILITGAANSIISVNQ